MKHAYIKSSTFIVTTTRSTLYLDEDLTIIEEFDPATIKSGDSEMLQLEHHVVYSTSYQVPVLYFKALYQGKKKIIGFGFYCVLKKEILTIDGTPLSLQEVYQQIVPDMYHDQVIITQTEHPLVGTPFWFIHPCDTRKLMNTIQFEYSNYIKTWISFNGPVVRCQIPKELFRKSKLLHAS